MCDPEGYALYGLRVIYAARLLYNELFYSTDTVPNNFIYGVRPVITLGPDVVLTTQDESGAWNLGISN